MGLPMTTLRSSIYTGIIELCCGGAALFAGAGAASILSSREVITLILLSLYFSVPGILSIIAGCKKDRVNMKVTLVLNIVGVFLAGLAIAVGGSFWAYLNTCNTQLLNSCVCGISEKHPYDDSCSDLKVVRNAIAVATNAFSLLVITCLVGFINSSIGAWNFKKDSNVAVAHAVPVDDNTISFPNRSTTDSRYHLYYPTMVSHDYQMAPPAYDTVVQQNV